MTFEEDLHLLAYKLSQGYEDVKTIAKACFMDKSVSPGASDF